MGCKSLNASPEADPPAYPNYVEGMGLYHTGGDYCALGVPEEYCETDLVIYDGSGIKPYYTQTPWTEYCPEFPGPPYAVDFDGTGLKAVVVEPMRCS